MRRYPPKRERELLATGRVFLEQIRPIKEALELPDDFEEALAEWHTRFAERLEQLAQARALYRQAKQAKDEAWRAVQDELRRLTRQLRAHPQFTDAMARALGMPVRDREPTPIEPGEEIPLLEVETRYGQHWVYFWHTGSRRGRRGKPEWARAARLVYAISEVDAPAPPREAMQFLASATRSPYIWTPPRVALGKWVWYCAAWETPRGALGAWSDYARAMGG